MRSLLSILVACGIAGGVVAQPAQSRARSFASRTADKAKALNDKKFEPSLIDPQAGVKLVVPALENVVSVVIGAFHADGLMVDWPAPRLIGPETGRTESELISKFFLSHISIERICLCASEPLSF